MPALQTSRYLARRPAVLVLAKGLLLTLGQLPLIQAAPFHPALLFAKEKKGEDAQEPGVWLYLGVAASLVLLGGAFAGLTIALMGQVSTIGWH
jgi:metal transporter CNNM